MSSVAPYGAATLAAVVYGLAACSSAYSTDAADTSDAAAPTDGSVFTNHDAADDAPPPTSDAGTTPPKDAAADAASCVVSEPGLVAYYPFDDGTARDCSGSGHNGTLTNAGSGTGKYGKALQLKGNGCVDLGADAAFVQGGAFTVAAWFNVTTTNGAAQYIVSKASGPPTTQGWRLALEGQNSNFSFKIGTPTGPALAASVGAAPPNTWVHVAAVFAPAAASAAVWVNGALAGSAPMAPGAIVDDPTARFRIGCGEGSDYVVGSIDEVKMYNRALTTAEIAALAK